MSEQSVFHSILGRDWGDLGDIIIQQQLSRSTLDIYESNQH